MRPAWSAHLPAGLDEVDLLARGTLVAAWMRTWSQEPARPLLHTSSRGWLTAGALERESQLVAGRLHGIGLRKGDRLLLSAPASPTLVVAQVAALRLGLVLVPANPAYRDRELKHLVNDARPRAALVTGQAARHWVRAADPSVAIAGPAVDLPDWPGSPPGLDQVAPADPALLIYTSGTTGAAKGALHTHASLLACAEALRIAWRWSESDRLILALPLFHAHGLCVGLFGGLLAGGSILLQPEFKVDAVLDAAAGATLFFGVPTMYARLAQSPRLGELARLRLCVSGSAPLAASLFEAIAAGGGQRVVERYGMSETLMNISNPVDGERRPGSVGLPLPGVEVELAPDGEILLRGPNLFSGYWRDPEATAAAFGEGGWFRTGDLAERAADGYYSIIGRSKELIITGGFNVHPREVEEVLLAHPAVAEVAVAGTPSAEWGEVVTAYVVARDAPPEPDELIAFASARLVAYKRPRLVHLVTGLPRNALGKVIRAALRPP